MKKITFCLILFLSFFSIQTFGQTYSTGLIQLSTEPGLRYSAQIDVTATEVTLTLVGPSDRWLGLGFDATSMTSDKDVVIFDGTNLTDRSFLYLGAVPPMDVEQDWTIQSNTVVDGTRTLEATRVLDTGNADDYVFSTSAYAINLVWAMAANSDFTVEFANYHFENKGIAMESFTLSQDEVAFGEFSMFPNPSTSKLNILIPRLQDEAQMTVFDVLGKKIFSRTLKNNLNKIDISQWNSGVYLIKLSTQKHTETRRFVKR